jgi:integrase
MAKNLNHHLYQKPTSGVWYFQKKVRGLKKFYKLSLETKSVVDARRKRDELLKQIQIHGRIPKEEPIAVSDSMLFGEVAQRWSEIIKTRIEDTTFANYRKIMNKHVLPAFGNTPIADITSLDIETFISKLNVRSKTKLNILTPFRLVMKFGKKHGIIRSNPFADVDPIKSSKSRPAGVLSLDEIRRFLEVLDDFWKPLFILLFFTGVRIGEAAGLKWKRVDLVNGVVQIRKSIVYVNGGYVYKKPKTESSIRDVKLPKFVVDALREQRKRTWKGEGENFVFLNKEGRHLHRHTLNRTVIKPALKKIQATTHISARDTRASYITNALDQNERMSFIQKQVGHTTTRMIVDHYYRHVPAPDDGDRLEGAWNSTTFLPPLKDADFQVSEKTG